MDWIDWGDAPTWVGTLIALGAALFTWQQARHAKASAIDAKEALANAIRPIFAFDADVTGAIGVTVTGEHPAVDVIVTVTGDGGREHGRGRADRIAGKVPGTLTGTADLTVPLHGLHPPTALGETMVLTITTRASDQKGLRRWEQSGRITWEVRQRTPRSEPEIEAVKFDQGAPELYAPSR